MIDSLLSARGLSIADMRSQPSQTVTFSQGLRSSVFERCLKHEDAKVDCFPAKFAEVGLIERCEEIFKELESESRDSLKLVTLRTPHIQNSWFSNLPVFRRGKRVTNPLYMCEQDAALRGLCTGDAVKVSTAHGSVDTQVCISDEVRQGTVAMSHGFGHQHSFGLRLASTLPGANYNALLPTGMGSYEPLSHMSWMSGVPVSVEKLTS